MRDMRPVGEHELQSVLALRQRHLPSTRYRSAAGVMLAIANAASKASPTLIDVIISSSPTGLKRDRAGAIRTLNQDQPQAHPARRSEPLAS